jgi:hypothetical protein
MRILIQHDPVLPAFVSFCYRVRSPDRFLCDIGARRPRRRGSIGLYAGGKLSIRPSSVSRGSRERLHGGLDCGGKR